MSRPTLSQPREAGAGAGRPDLCDPHEIRRLRHLAHLAFDRLWQCGLMRRTRAYEKLALVMGVPRERCHFSQFTAEQCLWVIDFMGGADIRPLGRADYCNARQWRHAKRQLREQAQLEAAGWGEGVAA